MHDGLELVELVHCLIAEVVSEDLDLPHVVIRTNATTHHLTYAGPFATAMAALAATDAQEREEQALPSSMRSRYQVAPLHPASDELA
jgi:F420-dependent methylenetetrahydromethanopterin dehydrogenase